MQNPCQNVKGESHLTKTKAKSMVVISKRGPNSYAVMYYEPVSRAWWEARNGARYSRMDAYLLQRAMRAELVEGFED